MGNLKTTSRVKESASSNFRDSSEELQRFRERHEAWIALEYGGEDGVAYSLHPEHFDACIGLFRLDDKCRGAELDLATVCDRNGAIGICEDRFIKYSLLQPPLAWPSHLDLSAFLELGWTQSDIAAVANLSNPTDKIHDRLRAAAGRLISMPAFLDARGRLRQAWRALPSSIRPLLPIARSGRTEAPEALGLELAPAAVAPFIQKFDEFCDEWHLLGMTTWDLPDVRGPNWVPGFADEDSLRRGDFTINTPWHFPVLNEDRLGGVLEDEHRRQAAERGIKDADSWASYSSLLDIYFWELVLCQRYSQQERVGKFKTGMESVLSKIVGLSVARIQKLRKWLHALQTGSLKTLQGKR
jgi:hypothetical protein